MLFLLPCFKYCRCRRLRKILENNVSAKDPSYKELIQFLKTDQTDTIPYYYDSFVCADFAEAVHNNAEKSGIKAGYVGVDFYEIRRWACMQCFQYNR